MDDKLLPWPELIERIRARTPARVLSGRAGAAYRTATQLRLRHDHAAARDAVRAELDLNRDLGPEFVRKWDILEVSTMARSKDEYLHRPDLGRRLDSEAHRRVTEQFPICADLQIVIGDGLSVTAVSAQAPKVLPPLLEKALEHGWTFGRTLAVRHCRVGVMNDIGELLRPKVMVLLIGERPGLATAESLSAYMAYQPRAGHTDANRNLISNIHARGIEPAEAASRITSLANEMMRQQMSGVELKESKHGGDLMIE